MTPSPAPAPDLLRRDDDAGVATLTLQSPASRNALSLAMIEALIDAFAAIETDRGDAGRRPRRRRTRAFRWP